MSTDLGFVILCLQDMSRFFFFFIYIALVNIYFSLTTTIYLVILLLHISSVWNKPTLTRSVGSDHHYIYFTTTISKI